MTLAIWGVRHHGPGCSRALVSALEAYRPDMILVEGPPEGSTALKRVLEARPPVALIVYPTNEPKLGHIYPFAEYSPEWVAIRYAKARRISVKFFDLPIKNAFALKEAAAKADEATANVSEEGEDGAEKTTELSLADEIRLDPIKALANVAGEPSPERWEYRLLEQASTPGDFFPVFLDATTELRLTLRDEAFQNETADESSRSEAPANAEARDDPNAETGAVDLRELARLAASVAKTSGGSADPLEPLREAAMRREIRRALQTSKRVAVVCGAWHAPALDLETDDPRRRLLIPSQEDDEALFRNLPETKTEATWIPWTHSRLDRRSGYGAGIESPEWLLEIWRASDEARRLDEIVAESQSVAKARRASKKKPVGGRESFRLASTRFLSRAAQFLRDDQIQASTANVVEALRLAEALAALRDRTTPSLDELREAAISVLCGGSETLYATIHERLEIGNELGAVPSDSPSPPLARDVETEQRRLGLKRSATEEKVDLDVREERDRQISRLFRRLNFIDVPWARPLAETPRAGTFSELWSYIWRPEFEVAIVDASRYGSSLVEAASNLAVARLEKTTTLAAIVELTELVLNAELNETAIDQIYQKLQDGVNLTDDVADAIAALPSLARILRYGTARGRADARLGPIFAALFDRATARLREVCVNIDVDVAENLALKLAELYPAVLPLSDDPNFKGRFDSLPTRLLDAFERVVGDPTTSRYLVGFLARELYEYKRWNRDELTKQLSFFLSPGVALDDVAAWLQGFLLETAGSILWYDELWRILDERIMSFDLESFYDRLPLLRRAFAVFSKAELRELGYVVANLYAEKESEDAAPEENGDVWDQSESQPLVQSLDFIFNGGAKD